MEKEKVFVDNPFVIPYQTRGAWFEKFNRLVEAGDPAMPLTELPVVGQHAAAEYTEQNKRLLLAIRRYLRVTVQAAQLVKMTILLFSTAGVLMRRYGAKNTLEALERDGIRENTVWNKRLLGANAQTVGLFYQKGVFSFGEDNFNETLKKYAIYYSPLIHNDPVSRQEICEGGIAILVPVKDKNPDYQSYVYSIANDLMGDFYYNNAVNSFYDDLEQGIMQIDSSLDRGRLYITYCNQSMQKILGLAPGESYYQRARELFDPLPANEKFWELIEHNQKVRDLQMELSLQGRVVSCVVSTTSLYQPRVGPEGILFSVKTEQQIAENVSSHMGNNAVLTFKDIIGQSPEITAAVDKARQVSQAFGNVLLRGESGVGKDVFAQAIHNGSSRRKKPFIAVNCGALPRDLIASELFGYDAGAFTGAKKQGNIGKFELANGGTIFLDEIGELPLDLQATLLRVVEEKRLMRLGSNRYIDVDVRIVSATNADLPEMIQQKRFRADLYYRLSMIQLQLPPLRERGNDIVELADYFIQRTASRIGRVRPIALGEESKKLLRSLPWRGNVRELQNLMECVTQLCPNTLITPDQIRENISMPDYFREPEPVRPKVEEPAPVLVQPVQSVPMQPMIRHVELTAEEIRSILAACGNNKSAAARYLGISVRTLYRKMEKLGMA